MTVPKGAVKNPVEISIAALRNVPDLAMEENEVLASCGIHCSPSGNRFKVPVKITLPHCAFISKAATVQAILYRSHSNKGL